MRIGIIGTRGIPNQYGGYEQFAEYAAPELVRRGHEVYVYNSSLHPYAEKIWNGVHIITKYDPENRIGTAGQFIYDLNCIIDSRKRNFDVILQLGYTSSSVWSFAFPKKAVLVTNMDGLEWKRSKYSPRVQQFLQRAERWAAIYSDYLIADSKAIQTHLKEKYQKDSEFIAYGAEEAGPANPDVPSQKGLKPFGYHLIISRMEPENNVETVIKGHIESGEQLPLVLIGNYKNGFGSYLHKKYASEKILFLGAVYDIRVLNSLRQFAFYYFHGHSVGGTNPSLLEAMASHVLISAHDNPFNRAVLEEDAFYFSSAADVAALFRADHQRKDFQFMVDNNLRRIREQYSWNYIIDRLENYLKHVCQPAKMD